MYTLVSLSYNATHNWKTLAINRYLHLVLSVNCVTTVSKCNINLYVFEKQFTLKLFKL